jgi:3D (Asp-Asp-Asp) domain-containing protein
VKLYENNLQYRVQIVKDFLEDNDIDCFLVDKKDSAYQFGTFQLFVKRDNVLRANKLIDDHLTFN